MKNGKYKLRLFRGLVRINYDKDRLLEKHTFTQWIVPWMFYVPGLVSQPAHLILELSLIPLLAYHRQPNLSISSSIESPSMEYEIKNALIEIIMLLFLAKVKNKACLPQLLSPFVLLVHLRTIRSHLGVIRKSVVLLIRKWERLAGWR